jgi:MoaA/NifB/PqqE/SkfB family radical SAM enzyme
MRILNVRLGHACNSSSSHSLVFLPGCADDYDGGQEFGWENFTLATATAKLNYLSQQIFVVLSRQMEEETAYALAAGLTFVPPDRDGSVDHQSVWDSFPTKWDGKELDLDFLKDFRDYILRDGVVILGGNDNSDGHPLSEIAAAVPLGRDVLSSYSGAHVARHDPDLNVWVLFNRNTGAKVRIAFGNDTADPSVPHADLNKAAAPELVDMKVTDKCPYECEHCYQGSTKNAAHADFKYMLEKLDELASMHVFEVAYGGGEPTTHPDFLQLLKETKNRKVVPNFTTRNLTYLKTHGKELVNLVGRIAYSVDFEEEIAAFTKYHTANKDKKGNSESVFSLTRSGSYERSIGIQHVVGSVSQERLVELLKYCKENWVDVTLLGWKNTGRGSEVQPHVVDWKAACKTADIYRMKIDTALARSSDMSDVDPETYHTTEGSVSCYIDAVERKIGPSSYAPSLLMRPCTNVADDWKRVRVEHGA